jgi:hypothetical protein
MNYNPSTIARIADIHNGILVETTKELAYTSWGTAQAYIFRHYNRIIIHAMWLEVGITTLGSAGASTLKFNWRSTTPSITVQDISAASADNAGMVQGRRVTIAGTSITTGLSVNGSAGISVIGSAAQMMVGVAPNGSTITTSIGEIGCLYGTTALNAGTGSFGILYTPVDDGAYVVALL